MSIFGVSAEQVRLIVRQELTAHNLRAQGDKLAESVVNALKVAEDGVDATPRRCRICCAEKWFEGRKVRLACNCNTAANQVRYEAKLRLVKDTSAELIRAEARVVQYRSDLRRSEPLTACAHMLLIEQLNSAEKYANALSVRFTALLDELATFKVM